MKLYIRLIGVFFSILCIFISIRYITTKAIAVPKVKFYTQIKSSYKLGDTISLNISSPGYSGKVQYRAVLYNNMTKKAQDKWTVGDKYNKINIPQGNGTFKLQWRIDQPGNYSIIVYAKRRGLPSSKTINKKYNYDSYAKSTSFSVDKKILYFTLDSTKQEVVNALGAPTRVWGEDKIYFMQYKKGTIYLDSATTQGKVVGWCNNGIPNITLGTKNPSAPSFSIGSSMSDVTGVMGAPKFIPPYYLNDKDDYWIYPDESIVFFDRDKRVVSYINKGSLKVFLGTRDPLAQPITYTSKIDEVIRAMGTPDTINAFFIESADYKRYGISITRYPNPYEGDSYSVKFNSNYTYYQYKNSFVAFDKNEKLIYFVNKGNLNLNFGAKDQSSKGIRVDSTEEDIIKAMGTPDLILDNSDYKRNWFYGDSYIKVDDNGKIVGWVNKGNLNISKDDKDPNAQIINIGSTKEEVIKAMGTPTQFSFNYWEYGEAQIRFETNERVETIYKTKGVKLSNLQKDDSSNGFDMGSSMDDVMRAMGEPDEVRRSSNLKYIEWLYGLDRLGGFPRATVSFNSDGKVVFWDDRYDDATKLKIGTSSQFDPLSPPITIGSSMDDVLKAMGNPTSLDPPDSNNIWWFYGSSRIIFGGDKKVIGWSGKGTKLKVYLGDKVEEYVFSFGASKEEVLKAMGTPKAVLNEMWGYDSCWISFDQTTNKLVAYTNTTGLNMEKVQPDPAAMFGYGSSQDEVIKAMGLPDKIYIQEASAVSVYDIYSAWWYGGSKINFNNEGKVLNWFNNEGNLKIQN